MPTKHDDMMAEDYDFSQGRRGAVLPHTGKTRITMWIDTEVLDWFRAQAERQGQGYQTALNAALREYTEREDGGLRAQVRGFVHAELEALFSPDQLEALFGSDRFKDLFGATPQDLLGNVPKRRR